LKTRNRCHYLPQSWGRSPVPTDLEKLSREAFAQASLAQFGRVDALVNNAGYAQMGPVELIPHQAAKRQFEINLLGPLALIRALVPIMRDSGGGHHY